MAFLALVSIGCWVGSSVNLWVSFRWVSNFLFSFLFNNSIVQRNEGFESWISYLGTSWDANWLSYMNFGRKKWRKKKKTNFFTKYSTIFFLGERNTVLVDGRLYCRNFSVISNWFVCDETSWALPPFCQSCLSRLVWLIAAPWKIIKIFFWE